MRGLICILALTLCTIAADGQLFTGRQSNRIVEGAQKVRVDKKSGQVEYFEFSADYLKSGDLIEGAFLQEKLGLPSRYKLHLYDRHIDARGEKHTKYQLYLNDIPVEGMGYVVHFKNGKAISANGKVVKDKVLPSVVTITPQQAVVKAISLFGPSVFVWDKDKTLYPEAKLLYVSQDTMLTLCYQIDVYSLTPLQRTYIYLDAVTGDVVKRINRIHHADYQASALTLYSGTVELTTSKNAQGYILNEYSRGNGIFTYSLNHSQYYTEAVELVDEDNYWDSAKDKVAYDAHYGAEKTYDYFFNKFGRNSIDGYGMALKSYVHYGEAYNNAFWDGEKMSYGDGDGYSTSAFASLDIVAHEICHGLTSYTADLEYAYESGALSESFSDIFGVSVDFYANPSIANYLVGEQIFLDGTAYMRNLSNPKSAFHPDTYKGDYWVSGTADYGGVHTNSMVQNYWFYLLCEGGSGVNDNGNSYMVEAIGLDAAEAIAYRNLTVYLNRYSDFDDARFYAIQSAIDLFGHCSNEVIQVTNAWHAVGVGQPFSNAVTAAFEAKQTYFCNPPASVELKSISTLAESYRWYLNGQEFSAEQNPIITILSAGDYDVKLEVDGTSACNSSDAVEVKKYISVVNEDIPVPAVDTPASIQNGSGGVYSVQLNQIDHRSQGADEGYADFSCGSRTVLTEGKVYPLSIRTGTGFKEVVGVWIDINNDGLFADKEERIFTSSATTYHSGELRIPAGLFFDIPLRMRVGSDRYDYAETLDAKSDSHYGQYEDYTVVLQKNTTPPVARFAMSDSIVMVGGAVTFLDVSENISTSRSWHFEGGDPEYSSEHNPVVSYTQDGIYTIELTVENEFGSSKLTKQISVATHFILGTDTQSSFAAGYIYDSGGADGNYENNVKHTFLIEPNCAKEILLTIEAFETEGCCDVLKIYDGKEEAAPLLASIKGIIDVPMLLKASSGSMLLVFTTDNSFAYPGFKARWRMLGYDTGPQVKADFDIAEEYLPVNYILQFEDNSLAAPRIWNWDFGDGSTSAEQHPKYSYSLPGSYEVELAVDNCVSKDVLKKPIVISEAPNMLVLTDTIRIHLLSGEKVDSFIVVDNLNNGLLAYEAQLNALYKKGDRQNPLRYYSFVPDFDGVNVGMMKNVFYYPDLKNILESNGAVCTHITALNFTSTLNSLDVLIVDDSADLLDTNKDKVREWISQGGFLIIQGDGIINYYNQILEGTGVRYVAQASKGGDGILVHHPITESISQYVISSYAECSLNVSTPAVRLINDGDGNCYSALADWGKGKILAMGDESFQYMSTAGHQQFLINALGYCVTSLNASICELIPGFSFVEGIATDSLKYKIDSNRLIEGAYVADIQINNNDILLGEVSVPILLHVTGIEHIQADVNEIVFADVAVNTDKWVSFNVKNTGTRNLSITNMSSTTDVFSVDFVPLELVPGQTHSFDVKFAPSSHQDYAATLRIYSSDPDVPVLSIAMDGSTVANTNNAPVCFADVADVNIRMNGAPALIVLNDHFSDADGDAMKYSCVLSAPDIIDYDISDGLLQLLPKSVGSIGVTISAYDGQGGVTSHTFIATVEVGTDVHAWDSSERFIRIYPNPLRSILYVEVDGDIDMVEVINVSGSFVKAICDINADKAKVNMSNLPVGTYVIRVHTTNKIFSVKVVKNR